MPQQITLFEQGQNGNFLSFLRGGACVTIGKRKLSHTYSDIISLENLSLAWEEFIVGKKKKIDVINFGRNLMDNIVELHESLVNRTYSHGNYESFYITDPKRRHIHKASVRDRLLHHAVYRILYPFFDRTYIADSYSCRNNKGTHRALDRFKQIALKVSKNNTRTGWVLKCDIKKFFASIDHEILLGILREYIDDENIISLFGNIIGSFQTDSRRKVGLPLGNLTSQLLSNVYMNRFDQWVKHRLKVKYYIRYADDFVFLSEDKNYLISIIPLVQEFLQTNLKLSLHPDKLFLKTIASGVDFLGWVHFSDHRVLRTKTKRRMLRKIRKKIDKQSLQSYLGLLRHGNAAKINKQVEVERWLWS
ncbi:MAG: group II intron reverse transcriptase domain-containing protein [Candidatus Magasanikbacteria bacterium]|nr:group II intron reverse transcriptase domain-containing protein [Candidatus Magasanikbacteria bacterium]